MDWRVKGMIQKVLGYVPEGDRIHYWLQRRGGGLADFDRECDIKVDDWGLMIGHLRDAKIPIVGTRFLEMGTGWYPTFPFALFLGGAKSVDTLDLNPHLKPDRVLALVARLERHVGRIAEMSGRPVKEVASEQQELAAAIRRGAPLDEATGGVVRYRAPADASDTKLPAKSIDVVFSNSVLEHVPGDVIAACFAEARRVLRAGGIVFHSVNCGDHYAYVDKTITQLHYLQYSDDEWAKWNNRFLYQNRLRAIDFTKMAKDAGFAIELDTSRAKPERLKLLDEMRVAPCFDRYSRDQLAITSIDFIGRNP
ncbi:MAG TPA: class I SAM-dependent methyltransferase [Kofleriaceae bacterium]|nr:class I SAM-dependent methyltransferase [Kofleriaceae bacterium]